MKMRTFVQTTNFVFIGGIEQPRARRVRINSSHNEYLGKYLLLCNSCF